MSGSMTGWVQENWVFIKYRLFAFVTRIIFVKPWDALISPQPIKMKQKVKGNVKMLYASKEKSRNYKI